MGRGSKGFRGKGRGDSWGEGEGIQGRVEGIQGVGLKGRSRGFRGEGQGGS